MQASLARSRNLGVALAVLTAGALFFSPAGARWHDDTWVEGDLVDVQICVEGRPAPLYPSPRGDAREYFQAVENRNYSITVRNETGERIGVLIAVDGLNVVSGERTGLSPHEGMYILGPWETSTIQGWRTSLDDIQRFVFVDEHSSYAERTGQANGDLGWVRVLAFRESRPGRIRPHDYRSGRLPFHDQDDGRGESPSAAPPANAESKELSREARPQNEPLAGRERDDSYPGTGWGDHRHDSVRRVEFMAERAATDQHVLRYEYASGLQALGIFPSHDRLRDRDHGDLGFARPPQR